MSDETIILIDSASATVEKRNIAFIASIDDAAPAKFLLSIADFKAFGIEDAKADPAASVAMISTNLAALIREKVRKDDLQPTTRLAAF